MPTATRTVKSVGGQTISAEKQYSGDERIVQQFTVADGQTDQQRTLNIDISELQYAMILSDKDILCEVNSASVPVPSISLKANVPFEDIPGDMYHVALLTADVTDLYFTNTSGATATIKIVVIQNNTP